MEFDVGFYLRDFITRAEKIPPEINDAFTQITESEKEFQELRKRIYHSQKALHKFVKLHGPQALNPNEESTIKAIKGDFESGIDLADRKIELAEKCIKLVEEQSRHLDNHLKEIGEESPEPYDTPIRKSATPPIFNITPLRSTTRRRIGIQKATKSIRKRRKSIKLEADEEIPLPEEYVQDEKLYCLCQQVSFGDMIACDNGEEKCPYGGWFHLECLGLSEVPIGKWYCSECSASVKKLKKKILP